MVVGTAAQAPAVMVKEAAGHLEKVAAATADCSVLAVAEAAAAGVAAHAVEMMMAAVMVEDCTVRVDCAVDWRVWGALDVVAQAVVAWEMMARVGAETAVEATKVGAVAVGATAM